MGVVMLINLSDVLTTEGMRSTKEVPLEMTCFHNGVGEFEILSKSKVCFTFTNVETGRAKVKCRVRLEFRASCDRCLTDVPVILNLDSERMVLSPEAEAKEEDDADEGGFMKDYQLDVEAFVQHEILVSWPTKILCKEDCKGICPVCGQDLNLGECGCDTFVPDPRMAVIQDIYSANKEV